MNQPLSSEKISRLPVIGLILSIIIPPVGVVVSFIALKRHKSRRSLAITGVILGAILTPVALIAAYYYYVLITAFNGFARNPDAPWNQPNVAEVTVQPLTDYLESTDAKQICEGGDNGRTLDNTTPHYRAIYRVKDDPAIITSLDNILTTAGYTALLPDDNYKFQRNGYYVDTATSKSSLLFCDGTNQGNTKSAPAGYAFLEINAVAPNTQPTTPPSVSPTP